MALGTIIGIILVAIIAGCIAILAIPALKPKKRGYQSNFKRIYQPFTGDRVAENFTYKRQMQSFPYHQIYRQQQKYAQKSNQYSECEIMKNI